MDEKTCDSGKKARQFSIPAHAIMLFPFLEWSEILACIKMSGIILSIFSGAWFLTGFCFPCPVRISWWKRLGLCRTEICRLCRQLWFYGDRYGMSGHGGHPLRITIHKGNRSLFHRVSCRNADNRIAYLRRFHFKSRMHDEKYFPKGVGR